MSAHIPRALVPVERGLLMSDVIVLDRDPASVFLAATYRAAHVLCTTTIYPGQEAVLAAYAALPDTGAACTVADPLVGLVRADERMHTWIRRGVFGEPVTPYGLPVVGDADRLANLGWLTGLLSRLAAQRLDGLPVPDGTLTFLTSVCADPQLLAGWSEARGGLVIDALLHAHPSVLAWSRSVAQLSRAVPPVGGSAAS